MAGVDHTREYVVANGTAPPCPQWICGSHDVVERPQYIALRPVAQLSRPFRHLTVLAMSGYALLRSARPKSGPI
jgi:hypothetical protein